jgi:hypothetical protein
MKKKRFIVRVNVEYSRVVEADTGEEAIENAPIETLFDWDSAWSIFEAEEEGK